VARQTRQIKEIKPLESELKPRSGESLSRTKDKLIERLGEQSQRIEKMRAVLENLHETRGRNAPRAAAVKARGQTDHNRRRGNE
jgi:hypothetical protein